jgi:hypothetical protein
MKQNTKLKKGKMPKSTNPALSLSEPHDKLLTEKEAAPIVGFTFRTLQQRRYMGLPPDYVRLPDSDSIRYRLSDLLAYVEQGIQRPAEGVL